MLPLEKEYGMPPNRRQIILTFVAACGLTALAGCASGGGEGGVRRDPNRITAEELANYTSLTVFEVVQRLRPRWLQRRGSEQDPVVYQDGNRIGFAGDVLPGMAVTGIDSMRYLSPSDATTRFGTGHGAGAIEITTRRM